MSEAVPSSALEMTEISPPQEETSPVEQAEPLPQNPPAPAFETVTYVVKAGDTFTKIWTAHGGSVRGALAAMKAIKTAELDIPGIREREKLSLTLAPSGDILMLQRKLRDGRILILEGSSSDGYSARIEQQEVVEQERVASGTITHSFAAAANDNAVPYTVVNELVDLFSDRIEFSRSIRRGDTFTVIYSSRHSSEGEELEPGPVRAASLKIDGKLMVAVRHVAEDGTARYFDESGQPLGNFFLRYPVQFTRISSSFSTARFHPVLKRTRPHNGVDFAAPIGTPVRAVADGVVVTAAFSGGAGNMIKLQHGDRYSTAYLHLSRIAKNVRPGARVTRGQVIGAVGMTGLATGPHLHFSFFDRGRYVNPLTIELPRLPEKFNPVPKGYLQAALQELHAEHSKIQLAAAGDVSVPKA
jgi:murein DD-endopeptidase MepM/ murein hydrolase activator NlpD